MARWLAEDHERHARSRWRSNSTWDSAAVYFWVSEIHSLLWAPAAHALFIACRSRSSSWIACRNWASSSAQFECWFSTSDCGQPDACGFTVQMSTCRIATQPPCPFETVPGPQAGGGGQFFPLHGFDGGGGQFLPTHGLGAFASSGRRRWNRRATQLCDFVAGCCGLTFVGMAFPAFGFAFSELRRWLGTGLEPSRSGLDPDRGEFEFPLGEPRFGEPAEEPAFEPPVAA